MSLEAILVALAGLGFVGRGATNWSHCHLGNAPHSETATSACGYSSARRSTFSTYPLGFALRSRPPADM